MTKAGTARYRRENPGSKLKTAVTGKVKKGSKAAKRRKSFCARSAGQMKNFQKLLKILTQDYVKQEEDGNVKNYIGNIYITILSKNFRCRYKYCQQHGCDR